MFLGIGASVAGPEINVPLVAVARRVSHIMLKVTGYVMYALPRAIFAAIRVGDCHLWSRYSAELCLLYWQLQYVAISPAWCCWQRVTWC